MTEQQFTDKVQQITGKNLQDDYGYIMGTNTPWESECGQLSETMEQGFKVWKRGKQNVVKTIDNTNLTQQQTLEIIIDFLNKN